jgi:hypothetical protein
MSVLARPKHHKRQPSSKRASVSLHASLAIAWMPPAEIDHGAWVAAGRRIGEYGRVSNWWVGDWLQYGTSRWGEKYVEASRITGFDAKTLRNIAYVASRFDLSRRRGKLTWTHHAEIAALEPVQQEAWLERAVEQRLSATDLRVALRSWQRGNEDSDSGQSAQEGNEIAITCPHCAHPIPRSLLIIQRRNSSISRNAVDDDQQVAGCQEA